jgi:8-oxo-dGTP diphosphatase
MDQVAKELFLEVACALIRDDRGRFLVCRRAAHVRDAGFWEFPGGKIESGEGPAGCVRRELREELGVDAVAETPIASVEAQVSGRRIRLHGCPTILASIPVSSTDHDRIAFLSLEELLSLPVTEAEWALLQKLKNELSFRKF